MSDECSAQSGGCDVPAICGVVTWYMELTRFVRGDMAVLWHVQLKPWLQDGMHAYLGAG